MKYRVKGIAFCSIELECVVEASSEREAIEEAKHYASEHKRDVVVGNSADEYHWWDWEPHIDGVVGD